VKLDKSSPVTNSNRVSHWEIKPEKRSICALDCGMKRTCTHRGLQREEQRQKTAALLFDDSPCFDMEARLTNAKKVFELYHDFSMMRDPSSILQNHIYLCC
jgi:hypothetical protein